MEQGGDGDEVDEEDFRGLVQVFLKGSDRPCFDRYDRHLVGQRLQQTLNKFRPDGRLEEQPLEIGQPREEWGHRDRILPHHTTS